MCLFKNSNSKFHYQPKIVTHIKLFCLFILLISPLVVLQILLLSANREKWSTSNHETTSGRIKHRLNSSSVNNDLNRDHHLHQPHHHLERLDLIPLLTEDRPKNALLGNDSRVGEVFELGDLQDGINREDRIKALLRIRRQSLTKAVSLANSSSDTTRNNYTSSIDDTDNIAAGATQSLEHTELEAPVERSVEAGKQPDGSDVKRTMVLVSSKSGRFSELMPLDDLVVSPASDDQHSGRQDANEPNAHDFNSLVSGETVNDGNRIGHQEIRGPSLVELATAGTAAGLMLSALSAQGHYSGQPVHFSNGPLNQDELNQQATSAIEETDLNSEAESLQPFDKDLATLQSRRQQDDGEPTGVSPEPANQRPQPEVVDVEGIEQQMPDSMESLMKSENEDATSTADGELGEQFPQSVANSDESGGQHISQQHPRRDDIGTLPSQSAAARAIDDEQDNDDDGDNDANDGDYERRLPLGQNQISRPLSSGNGLINQFSGNSQADKLLHTLPRGQNVFARSYNQLSEVPLRNSMTDLNTAAGHYYGKKKKKKKVIIKKKKKKKVKKYKLKKVKIVKYKKKKVKKKKKKKKHVHKKPMHHDHGKYYMYAKVPKKKSWEFGFKKGNKKHWIERHEKGHKNKFKTKVKWFDKKSKGKGIHIWDYNHHDKKKKKHY